jgi:hypothetical protein
MTIAYPDTRLRIDGAWRGSEAIEAYLVTKYVTEMAA